MVRKSPAPVTVWPHSINSFSEVLSIRSSPLVSTSNDMAEMKRNANSEKTIY